MKTVILMPSVAEAVIVARDTQGREVNIASLEITPTFWTPKYSPNLLFFETRLDDYDEEDEDGKVTPCRGDLVQRGSITVSGTTGKLAVSDRTKPGRSKLEEQLDQEESDDTEDEEEEEETTTRRKAKGAR